METQQVIYMFMDYCCNGDLLEYIKEYGCFPEEKAKHYFRQLVEAVAYLHDLDIAHRDIKCENIFLMANKQVKLGDFGFARMCTDDYGKRILSDTFCGSAAYAAPEILKVNTLNDERKVNRRAQKMQQNLVNTHWLAASILCAAI